MRTSYKMRTAFKLRVSDITFYMLRVSDDKFRASNEKLRVSDDDESEFNHVIMYVNPVLQGSKACGGNMAESQQHDEGGYFM